MKSILEATPTLRDGERLNREEFVNRWEALPNLKFAELIGGIVHLRLFPLSLDHSDGGFTISNWLGAYAFATPGCVGSNDATWYMRDDAPQPECSLRILPEYGGQSSTITRDGKRFGVGAPELIVEVSLSTRDVDLGEKKELYRKAGVLEFPCIQPEKKKLNWFRLVGTKYVELKPKGGIYQSMVFPGLWLDTKAFFAGDSARVLDVLRDGLASPEYLMFKRELAGRRRSEGESEIK